MDLLKSFSGAGKEEDKHSGESKTHDSTTTTTGSGKKHSTSELFGDAKTVAEAARFAATGGMAKVDNAKTAGAASDLLEGAEDYGKFSEKGYGKYIDQAQSILHKYEGNAKPSDQHDQDNSHLEKYDGTPKLSNHQDEKKAEESGGVGGYLKMAQGFMK